MPDPCILKGQFFRQPVPVLCIPAAVVGRIHDPFSALGLVLPFLGSLAVHVHHKGFIVGKQNHIRPFLYHRGYIFAQLHLPAVIRAQLIRLLELAHFSVGVQNHMDPCLYHLFQQVQEPPEFLLEIYIPLSIAELLNAVFMVLVTQKSNAEHFRPVRCVNDQCAAELRVLPYIHHLLHQHHPAAGCFRPGYIHVLGASLCINKQRIREPGSKGTLPDALRPVNHYLFCPR